MDKLMLQYKTACSQQQKQKLQDSALSVEPAQGSAGASDTTDADTALQALQQAAAQVRRGICCFVLGQITSCLDIDTERDLPQSDMLMKLCLSSSAFVAVCCYALEMLILLQPCRLMPSLPRRLTCWSVSTAAKAWWSGTFNSSRRQIAVMRNAHTHITHLLEEKSATTQP
jgi:hypothetical protein